MKMIGEDYNRFDLELEFAFCVSKALPKKIDVFKKNGIALIGHNGDEVGKPIPKNPPVFHGPLSFVKFDMSNVFNDAIILFCDVWHGQTYIKMPKIRRFGRAKRSRTLASLP